MKFKTFLSVIENLSLLAGVGATNLQTKYLFFAFGVLHDRLSFWTEVVIQQFLFSVAASIV